MNEQKMSSITCSQNELYNDEVNFKDYHEYEDNWNRNIGKSERV